MIFPLHANLMQPNCLILNRTHSKQSNAAHNKTLQEIIRLQVVEALIRLELYNYLCIPCMVLLNALGIDVGSCQEAK